MARGIATTHYCVSCIRCKSWAIHFLLRPRISAPRFHVLAWEASGANRRFGIAAREFRLFSTRPRWRHPHRNNPLILALWKEKKNEREKENTIWRLKRPCVQSTNLASLSSLLSLNDLLQAYRPSPSPVHSKGHSTTDRTRAPGGLESYD